MRPDSCTSLPRMQVMTEYQPLPQTPSAGSPRLGIAAGISDFAKLRKGHKYYVDKTRKLAALLSDDSGPVLLTRPRRFGKTLTMDTLRRFLELDYRHPGDTTAQQELFAGLAILEDKECCERFMGQHPVVALSLNTVEGKNFEEALFRVRDAVAPLYDVFKPLLEAAGAVIDEDERLILKRYYRMGSLRNHGELEELLPMALPRLCSLLYRIYSRSVYILIDEYDTPLARAWSTEQSSAPEPAVPEDYYSSMATLMRGMLHPLLKPQPALSQAIARCICTGCTRVSRESLFSGANNLMVLGPEHRPSAALMGFTAEEVQSMLDYYELGDRMQEVEEWYDGYRFAGVRIYNPWSIANYCQAQLDTPGCAPVSYWTHAGRNDELLLCLHHMPRPGLEQLQRLSTGEQVEVPILQAFSYDELRQHPDQGALFTLLWHTGYITQGNDSSQSVAEGRRVMRIPNTEVRECFDRQILGLYDFQGEARSGCSAALVSALLEGMAEDVRLALNELLGRYLSFHAYVMHSALAGKVSSVLSEHRPELAAEFEVLDDRRPERVYQLYVMGVLSGFVGHRLRNLVMEQELGEGRADLSFISTDGQSGCVLEFKKAAVGVPETDNPSRCQLRRQAERTQAARQGLEQIETHGYARGLLQIYPALRTVQAYGVGCAGKSCAVTWRRYGREELENQNMQFQYR